MLREACVVLGKIFTAVFRDVSLHSLRPLLSTSAVLYKAQFFTSGKLVDHGGKLHAFTTMLSFESIIQIQKRKFESVFDYSENVDRWC